MTVNVNLLPESYRRARRHDRRFRRGLTISVILLFAELCTGLVLHARAEDTRELYAEADNARAAIASVRERLVEPTRQASLIDQQVILATRLRTTHRWSKLLGMLAGSTPERVVLCAVSTEPAKWSPALASLPDRRSNKRTAERIPVKPLIEGITVRGYAVDHDDLSKFMAAMSGSRAFASIDLKQARRERFMEEDAIAFEIECQW